MSDINEQAIFERTAMVLGDAALKKLKNSHVIVFGIGGVGGHAAEALVRSGLGKITVVDNDTVSVSNLNRQIIALAKDIGRFKTDVMEERLRDINPELCVIKRREFYLPQLRDTYDFGEYDYILDCIDTVTAKLDIIQTAGGSGVPVISAMGTGNKLYPEKLKICDVFETRNCPLAKVMRKELKKRNISSLTVVASDELPRTASEKGRIPGSVSFVPSAAGLMMAGYVVRKLTGIS